MAHTWQIIVDGTPVEDDLYTALTSLEVEESADMPGAIQLDLPVSLDDQGQLKYVSDDLFKPYANIAVVVQPDGASPECIFDGYVLSHKIHLDSGIAASTLQVWGQDASWLMNLEEKVKEWSGVTDASVASSIFGDYGISPASGNDEDDSAAHAEEGHTLMQRDTDIQFLRRLARRAGKLCRVICTDTPGSRVGVFAKPDLDADAKVTLSLNDPEAPNVSTLDFEWDVTRPSSVAVRQASFDDDDEDGASGDTDDAGLGTLDERDLATFAGKPMKVRLTAAADDAGELEARAKALLREAGFFVRCTGEADLSALKVVLRVGSVVAVEGVGSLHSGNYLVWSVRHKIDDDAHKMSFVLVRNAVGPAPTGGAGGLLGGLLS